MHENRETSVTPAVQPDSRSAGEGSGRTARTDVPEESHDGIVPMNYSNKDKRPLAENEEGRPSIKENACQPHTYPTQSGKGVTYQGGLTGSPPGVSSDHRHISTGDASAFPECGQRRFPLCLLPKNSQSSWKIGQELSAKSAGAWRTAMSAFSPFNRFHWEERVWFVYSWTIPLQPRMY